MTTALTTQQQELAQIQVLQSSLYPGASTESVRMVLAYCQAAQLDPMQKPVHIVPMWDGKSRTMRDVVMPGINLYRIQAMRSGQCACNTEPEFGQDKTQVDGNVEVTFPEWCRVTVKRRLPTGEIAEFSAVERWLENYAIKGGKDKDQSPNAMWRKRVYGQLSKCTQAQALRMAFPEFAAQYTAEEMEGKELHEVDMQETQPVMQEVPPALLNAAREAAEQGWQSLKVHLKSISMEDREALAPVAESLKETARNADTIDEVAA